jgi:hypothetical protein
VNFRAPVEEKQYIRSILFGGFRKCLPAMLRYGTLADVGHGRKPRIELSPNARRARESLHPYIEGRSVPWQGFHHLWWPAGPCRQVVFASDRAKHPG